MNYKCNDIKKKSLKVGMGTSYFHMIFTAGKIIQSFCRGSQSGVSFLMEKGSVKFRSIGDPKSKAGENECPCVFGKFFLCHPRKKLTAKGS
jgi:hypothetical protein